MKLENWFTTLTGSIYDAPEIRLLCLQGEVYGYKNSIFVDGDRIKTSPIVGKRGGKFLTSSGSEYTLGKVDRKYAKKYPYARKVLLSQLKEM